MKNIAIKLIIIGSIGSLLLFLYGFIVGVHNVISPSGEHIAKMNVEKAVKTSDQIPNNIVTLGDSLTRGVGDAKGLGYVGRFHQKLEKETNKKIVVTNLAVSGAKTEDLLRQLKKEGIQYSLKQADMIVLTIGGNNLFPGVNQLEKIDFTSYKSNVDQFQKDVTSILTKLKKLNNNAPIYWIGLYNPFGDMKKLEGSSAFVLLWNNTLQNIALSYSNVYVIPTFDLFQGKGKSLLYSDHFHPNGDGYELIANRLTDKVVNQLQTEGVE